MGDSDLLAGFFSQSRWIWAQSLASQKSGILPNQTRAHIYNFQCGYIGSLETGKKKETLCQSTEDHEKQMKRFLLPAQLLIVVEAMQII